MVRVVIRDHRVRELEPLITALARTFRLSYFNNGGAHAAAYFARCFSKNAHTFFQPSSACSMR